MVEARAIVKCMICGKEASAPEFSDTVAVEMNVDSDGKFHGAQDHLNHAERKQGIAHVACYATWYEKTYGSPFTMSA